MWCFSRMQMPQSGIKKNYLKLENKTRIPHALLMSYCPTSPPRIINTLGQGGAGFFCNDPGNKYLRFVGHVVSVTMTQLYYYS